MAKKSNSKSVTTDATRAANLEAYVSAFTALQWAMNDACEKCSNQIGASLSALMIDDIECTVDAIKANDAQPFHSSSLVMLNSSSTVKHFYRFYKKSLDRLFVTVHYVHRRREVTLKDTKQFYGSTSFNADVEQKITLIQAENGWNRAQTIRALIAAGAEAMERQNASAARIASGCTQIDPAFFGAQA